MGKSVGLCKTTKRKDEQNGEILKKIGQRFNKEFMKFWSFTEYSPNILRNIGMNIQISDLMMSLPHNSQFIFFYTENWQNPMDF